MPTATKTAEKEKIPSAVTKQKRREQEAKKGVTSGKAYRMSKKLTDRVNSIAQTYAKFKDLEGSRLIYDEALKIKFDTLAGDLKSKDTIHQISALASLEMKAMLERYEKEGDFSRIFDEKIKETRKSTKDMKEAMKDDLKGLEKDIKKIFKKVENRQFSSIPQMMERFGIDKPAEKLADANNKMADVNANDLIEKFIKIKADEMLVRQLGDVSKILSAATRDTDALAKAKEILKNNEPSYYREILEGHLNNKTPSWWTAGGGGTGGTAGATRTGGGGGGGGGTGGGPTTTTGPTTHGPTSTGVYASKNWIKHAKDYYYGTKAEYSEHAFGKRPLQANGFVHWAGHTDAQKTEIDELFKKLDADRSMTTAMEIWRKLNGEWVDKANVFSSDEKRYFSNEIMHADTKDKALLVWMKMMPVDAIHHKRDMIEWMTQGEENKRYNKLISDSLDDQEVILGAIRSRVRITGTFAPTTEEKESFKKIFDDLNGYAQNIQTAEHSYLPDYIRLYSHMLTLHYTEDYSTGLKPGTLWEQLTGRNDDHPLDTYYDMYDLRRTAFQRRKLSDSDDDVDMPPMASPTGRSSSTIHPPPPPPPV